MTVYTKEACSWCRLCFINMSKRAGNSNLEYYSYMSGGMMSYFAATFTIGILLNNHFVLSVRRGTSIVENLSQLCLK